MLQSSIHAHEAPVGGSSMLSGRGAEPSGHIEHPVQYPQETSTVGTDCNSTISGRDEYLSTAQDTDSKAGSGNNLEGNARALSLQQSKSMEQNAASLATGAAQFPNNVKANKSRGQEHLTVMCTEDPLDTLPQVTLYQQRV